MVLGLKNYLFLFKAVKLARERSVVLLQLQLKLTVP